MKNWLIIGGGIVVTLAGAVWTLQGLNLLPGSPMSGVTIWAIIGPIVAIVGLALLGLGIALHRRAPDNKSN